jgi:Uma2 family endonuclease
MSRPYEEILYGQKVMRAAPGARHEVICDRLHQLLAASVADLAAVQLPAPRTTIALSAATKIRPDLALLDAASGDLFLAVEIVSRDDHRPDTVLKKEIYEEFRVPRLWMVDPRYDNVEIYHHSEYGLKLEAILAGKEVLAEASLPEFAVVIAELFAWDAPSPPP